MFLRAELDVLSVQIYFLRNTAERLCTAEPILGAWPLVHWAEFLSDRLVREAAFTLATSSLRDLSVLIQKAKALQYLVDFLICILHIRSRATESDALRKGLLTVVKAKHYQNSCLSGDGRVDSGRYLYDLVT